MPPVWALHIEQPLPPGTLETSLAVGVCRVASAACPSHSNADAIRCRGMVEERRRRSPDELTSSRPSYSRARPLGGLGAQDRLEILRDRVPVVALLDRASGGFAQLARRLTDRNGTDRKSTRLNSSHGYISYAVFCLKKKKKQLITTEHY